MDRVARGSSCCQQRLVAATLGATLTTGAHGEPTASLVALPGKAVVVADFNSPRPSCLVGWSGGYARAIAAVATFGAAGVSARARVPLPVLRLASQYGWGWRRLEGHMFAEGRAICFKYHSQASCAEPCPPNCEHGCQRCLCSHWDRDCPTRPLGGMGATKASA